MFDFATIPDLLRLVVLPAFGYLAWRDIKTRRIPHRTWYPLGALALVLLVWEGYMVITGDATALDQRLFLTRVSISVLVLVPLAYGFWLLGGFGGADTKAFMVIALLFPTYPEYHLWAVGIDGEFATLPLVATDVGVFSMTILANTVLLGALYPVALAGKNAVTGYVSPAMFVATPIEATDATRRYGVLLEFAEGRLRDARSLSAVRSHLSWRRLDLDALRMYLQWRGLDLASVRADPDRYRDPDSLPDEPNPPGTGSIANSDVGGTASAVETDGGTTDDPWGAEAFLDDIDGNAYGTTPEMLRDGLETLTEEDVVWISPGIPFIVPMFFGLVVSFVYGDLLFTLLGFLGVA
ncbi:A24 family peptidase C-terminal domain-containing protein [Halovenus salina]|uniref:A24 family peptidase C-terminal domain-containing protein n=1 Tax=Halovenus salina TaxID=1510225 RepID=UPI002260D0D1|nr:A24 family peptidase C-terminal domain-containing protein [Halovenus salina]